MTWITERNQESSHRDSSKHGTNKWERIGTMYSLILFYNYLFLSLSLSCRANSTEPGVTVRRRSPSLVMALTKSYGLLLFLAGFLKLANDLLAFVSPQILKWVKIFKGTCKYLIFNCAGCSLNMWRTLMSLFGKDISIPS